MDECKPLPPTMTPNRGGGTRAERRMPSTGGNPRVLTFTLISIWLPCNSLCKFWVTAWSRSRFAALKRRKLNLKAKLKAVIHILVSSA